MPSRVAKFGESPGFNLANSFARDRQPTANLIQRVLAVAGEAVVEPQNLALAIIERGHDLFELLRQLLFHHHLFRRWRGGIANEMAEALNLLFERYGKPTIAQVG